MNMAARLRTFRYNTGDEVLEGDFVIGAGGRPGRVVMIIQPGTSDANDFDCPDGGVLFMEVWGDGQESHVLMTPPDGEYWEDIEFLRRGNRV
jgi:hypothetical protein